jgi:hypothetical protein
MRPARSLVVGSSHTGKKGCDRSGNGQATSGRATGALADQCIEVCVGQSASFAQWTKMTVEAIHHIFKQRQALGL